MICKEVMVSVLHNQQIRRRSVFILKLRRLYSEKVQSSRLSWRKLLVILMMCLLLTSAFRTARQLLSHQQAISFPDESEIEYVLFQHLLPEAHVDIDVHELSVEVIEKLSVKNHVVRSGETLSELVQRYNLKNLDTIISYNNIKDARSLQVGSVLEIPNRDGLKYTVKRGDNLEKIARKFRASLNDILDANYLRSDIIQPGQRLFIPEARMSQPDLNKVLGELFLFPTQGRITSEFGLRHDPFTRMSRFHNGIDIANEIGTSILASKSGTVTTIGTNPTYGKYLILQHPDGYQTWYAHLSRVLVRHNQYVGRGYRIAEMGNTGYSTGSHLHFSIFKNGEPIDPLSELR